MRSGNLYIKIFIRLLLGSILSTVELILESDKEFCEEHCKYLFFIQSYCHKILCKLSLWSHVSFFSIDFNRNVCWKIRLSLISRFSREFQCSEKNIRKFWYLSHWIVINSRENFTTENYQTIHTQWELSIFSREFQWELTQPAITCSKITIETLEHGVKYVQS